MKLRRNQRLREISLNARAHIERMEQRIFLSAAVFSKPARSSVSLGPVLRPHTTQSTLKLDLPAGWSAKPTVQTGPGIQPDEISSSPNGTTPAQIRGAYGLGQYNSSSVTFNGAQADGSGQTICIVDSYDDPTALNDLNAFSTYFGLPTFNTGGPTFMKYGVTEGFGTGFGLTTTLPGTDPSSPAPDEGTWELEESLDIEWAHVMAPQANIALVEASDNGEGLYFGDYYAAGLTGAVVVSNSWEGYEFEGETGDDFFFTSPTGHIGGDGLPGGDTFLFASGDGGAYVEGISGGQFTPTYPGSSANVLSVGGTTLTVGAGNTYGGETAWGNGIYSGTEYGGGGGISSYESQPSWQSGFATPFSTTQRCYPDLSLEADPYTGVPVYDSYDNGASTPWGFLWGGTSLSCPMMAGIVAVADQGRNSIGQGSMDGVTTTIPTIYRIAGSSSYSTNFNDITSGNNGYAAGPGYDLTTGLGSVIGNTFLISLSGALTTINGTSGNDSIRMVRSGLADLVYVDNSTAAMYNVLYSTLPAVTIASSAGIDTVNVDFSGGATPVPATGLTVIGNGASTTLIATGTTGNDVATVGSNIISFNGSIINYSLLSSIVIDGNGGSDVLTQSAQPANSATVVFNGGTTGGPSSTDTLNVSAGTFSFAAPASGSGIAPISLASLLISANASVLVGTAPSHSDRWYLLLGGISLAGTTGAWTGKLDLGGNDMIIHNGNLGVLSNQLAGGLSRGLWTGNGIASAAAASDTTHRTAIGSYLNSSGTYSASNPFDGYAAAATDVLFKYTYYGDANLNGKVDASDYSLTDFGYIAAKTGWQYGDFNYDGHVDGSDYSLIDDLFNTQGSAM